LFFTAPAAPTAVNVVLDTAAYGKATVTWLAPAVGTADGYFVSVTPSTDFVRGKSCPLLLAFCSAACLGQIVSAYVCDCASFKLWDASRIILTAEKCVNEQKFLLCLKPFLTNYSTATLFYISATVKKDSFVFYKFWNATHFFCFISKWHILYCLRDVSRNLFQLNERYIWLLCHVVGIPGALKLNISQTLFSTSRWATWLRHRATQSRSSPFWMESTARLPHVCVSENFCSLSVNRQTSCVLQD